MSAVTAKRNCRKIEAFSLRGVAGPERQARCERVPALWCWRLRQTAHQAGGFLPGSR